MYFQYGTYRHDDNEVNLTRMNIRYRLSPRGLRLSRIITLYLQGEICEDTQAEITAKVQELINAYSVDYVNCALHQDDGTATPHGLDNGTSLTGVHVIQRSWPKGGPSEYATARTFSVTLEAEYPDTDSQLVEWEESLSYVGNTGPRFIVQDTYFGPFAQLTALKTTQRIVQFGRAVGFTAYVLPPGPLFPLIEHQDRRMVTLGSGKMQGQVACYFPTSWAYHFSTDVSIEAAPTTR